MRTEKKSWFKTNILEKMTVSMLLVIISVGTTYYLTNERRIDDIEDTVEQKTFSSIEMKAQTETYMASSYTEGKQIEAMNEMTDTYIDFNIKVDTTMSVYVKYFENMELHILRDNAILSLVRNSDSLYQVTVKMLEKVEDDLFIQKEFSKSLLKEIRTLKSLENFNGD